MDVYVYIYMQVAMPVCVSIYTCQCFSIHQAEPVGLIKEQIAVSDDNGLSQRELLKKVTSDY